MATHPLRLSASLIAPLAAAFALCMVASAAQAQAWPSKQIKLLVPLAPGSTADDVIDAEFTESK